MKVGDICFKTGTYEKAGETKNRYMKCGVLLQGDDGSFYGVIEALPVVGEGKFSVFADRPKTDAQPAQQNTQQSQNDFPY